MDLTVSSRDLVRLLDVLGEGVLFCSATADGDRWIYRNAALQRLLQEDPEQELIEEALERMLVEVRDADRTRSDPDCVVRLMQTRRGGYRLRGTRVGARRVDADAPLFAVVLERMQPAQLSSRELRDQYRLTAREADVARLLVEGRTNTELARALRISPSTAQHYTARVLLKLGVRNRTEAAARILRPE